MWRLRFSFARWAARRHLADPLLIAAVSDSETTNIPGELLQRKPDLQSDLIALNLAVLDRPAHLRDFEPAEIS
jgi:hypothetical protein